jgi:eukaryotic-like serine/threonine-protein kinase
VDPASPEGSSTRASTPVLPAGFDHERFEIRSTLGRGTSSTVYRTFDRQRGAEVALKVLSVHGSASMLAFKREFRSMADLVHPNLVKLYELHAAGEELMFTMELVDGNDFLGHVRRPIGAAPSWDAAEPRPAAPERATVAEWSGPAPERLRVGDFGELEYFPPLEPAQLPTLRAVTAQVVRGLMALHDAGHVHRDVKPSNVMVDDGGRAVLLDFGVAAELAGQAQTAGTPAYMSPEQAQGEPPSPSADFYAVGVMLYEALTGRLPHSGDDPVTDKLQRDPASPSSLVPNVPLDLDRLCMALLSRDPALRPEGPAILDLLCGDTERTLPPRNRTEIIPMLGRDDELRRIEAAMREVSRGRGRVVLVAGRSGMGKSALIRHFLARARRNGAVVLTGRCYEQESVPYKALDAVMDAVCQHLAAMPVEEREEVMPRHRWALGRLFPVLAQWSSAPLPVEQAPVERDPRASEALLELRQRQTLPVTTPQLTEDTGPLRAPMGIAAPPRAVTATRGIDPALAIRSTVVVGSPAMGSRNEPPVTTDPARIRRQGVAALRQLLEALARHAPLIIAIDDLQWGDLDSAQVLAEVLAPPQPPLLLVGSFRREDEDTSEFLRTFLAAQVGHEVISLEALDGAAALELARSLVRGTTRVGPAEVAQVAKGDPFLLVELARYVSSLDGEPMLSAHGLTVEAVVKARIEHLEPPARRLLEAVSVAAGPVARSVARRAANLGSQESTAVVQLRAANLLRVKGTRGVEVIETYHDRIRDAVQEQLGDDERRTWHLRLVHAMQAEGHEDHERIGRHLAATGRVAEAVPRYLQAAEAATATLAFDRAADLFRRALAPGVLPPADEVRVRRERADVLMRQGRHDEAASELTRCHAKMSPGLERARVLRRLGEVELARTDVPAAIEAFEQALADLDQPVPRGRRALVLADLREAAVQLGHTWFRSRRPRRPLGEAERLALGIYGRLTSAYYFNRDGLQVLWPHLRELNLAERHPATPELGRAWAGHGSMLAALPWYRRGLTYVERGLEVQRRLGDRFGEAQAMHQQGVVLYGASRFAEAARVSAEAAERLESMGEAPEAHEALLCVAQAKYRLGLVGEAAVLARRVHQAALDGGDVLAAASSVLVWVEASGGRVPSMMIRVQVEIAAQIDHSFGKLVALQATGIRLLGVGRPTEAAQVLDQTAEELRRSKLVATEVLSGVDVWRATAWRRVAEGARGAAERDEALHHAKQAARRGLWWTSRFRNGLPHALREAGRVSALTGGKQRARVLLEASAAVAQRHEQAQELALTRQLQAALFGRGRGGGPASGGEPTEMLAAGVRLHGAPLPR